MPPSKLSRSEIVDEAIALLREEGLKNVSLRKLAARLNVEAPSLYWHIGSKGELYGMMCESIFMEALDGIGPSSSWQGWLQQFGRGLWNSQLKIRDLGRLVLATEMGPERGPRMIEQVAERLRPFGIDAATAVRMQFSVQALIIGWGGYAFGPNASNFDGVVTIETAFDEALDVVVAGWDQHLSPRTALTAS
jgi:TetR/AcrR family transcriptional regulator, tetracycline repressor protein